MGTYFSSDIQKRLEEADDHRCAYCRTSEANTGQPMTFDHILPRSQGGDTAYNNLCFACRRCNEFKGSQTTATDPFTGEKVQLFHPRRDAWGEHFMWDDESSIFLIGLTAIGRATVLTLNMNNRVVA